MKDKLWTFSFVAACFGNFMLFFAFYLLLPILPMYLVEEFNASKSIVGIVLASYTVMALLFRPFAGFMVDKFPRKPLLMLCYFVFISYFCGYIFAGTIALFTIVRATHGIAFGIVTVSNSTMAIDLMPSSRRGEGIGFFGVASNLAMALGPVASLYMYDVIGKYDYIFLTSFVAGLIGFMAISTIKAPVKILAPRGKISLDRFLLVKGIPGAIALIFMTFSYGVLTTYVAIYGRDEVGITSGVGLFFILMSVGLIFSRLAVGKLINKGYITATISVGALVLIIAYITLTFLKTPIFFYCSALILGLAYGSLCPAFQTMFINLGEHNQRGTANATYYTSWDFGLGAGVLAGGSIAQTHSYTMSFTFGIAFLAIGLLLFVLYSAGYFNRHKLR